MGVQDSLGNSEWGCRIPYDSRDSIFPEGMPNSQGGCDTGSNIATMNLSMQFSLRLGFQGGLNSGT